MAITIQKSLSRIREELITAIAIMDERGKLNGGANSRLLWLKDWDALRHRLFVATEIIDDSHQYP